MKELPLEGVITETQIELTNTESGTIFLQEYNSPVSFNQTFTSRAVTSETTVIIENEETIAANQYYGLNYSASDGVMNPAVRITAITLRGEGVNPFV